ncbi:MAG: hypothetical protein ACI4E1_09785 [Lachnospira sp.]
MKIVRYRKDLINKAENYLLRSENAEDINALYDVLSLYESLEKDYDAQKAERLNLQMRKDYPIIEELEEIADEYAQDIADMQAVPVYRDLSEKIYADIRGIYVDALMRHGQIVSPCQFMYYLNDASLFMAGKYAKKYAKSTLYSFIA